MSSRLLQHGWQLLCTSSTRTVCRCALALGQPRLESPEQIPATSCPRLRLADLALAICQRTAECRRECRRQLAHATRPLPRQGRRRKPARPESPRTPSDGKPAGTRRRPPPQPQGSPPPGGQGPSNRTAQYVKERSAQGTPVRRPSRRRRCSRAAGRRGRCRAAGAARRRRPAPRRRAPPPLPPGCHRGRNTRSPTPRHPPPPPAGGERLPVLQRAGVRLSRPGRLPGSCPREAHPQQGRPISRPAAGRQCWGAEVAA